MTIPRRLGLVLGGGGLKGFAHVGALQALHDAGVEPRVLAGSSIGALLAAGAATGMSPDVMAHRAIALRRRDLFRINHVGMALERMRSPSIYREAPLRELVDSVCPDVRFDALTTPLLVNTVDVERGTQVVWGLPGLEGVSVADAVYASCALPGFFPPGQVGGRTCIDGGTLDNLPVSAAAGLGVDAIIAVDVGNSDLAHAADVASEGFASIFQRAASVMMHRLQLHPLSDWGTPPILLVRPRVAHLPWFGFGHAEALIAEGRRAMLEALEHLDACLDAEGGIWPRRLVQVRVDRHACTGCGLCTALAPHAMVLGADRIAQPRRSEMRWSPADGDFVRQCPTRAIHATGEEGETCAPESAEAVRALVTTGAHRATPPAARLTTDDEREERPRVRRRG